MQGCRKGVGSEVDVSRAIAQHEALIRRLACRLPGDFDDLCQAGRIGVWQCIQTYGKELPASLAIVCARREMVDEVRREAWGGTRCHRQFKVNHFTEDTDGYVFVSPDRTPNEAAKAMAYRQMDAEERFLIERRLEGYELPELGEMIGRSGSRACQIIYGALKRLA